LDHAWVLAQALQPILPWLAHEPLAGIHSIHVAESGNGWQRPDDAQHQYLLPSKRTRFMLRIPNTRLEAVRVLSGKTLKLADCALQIGEMKTKPFTNAAVLFARYVLSSADESEPEFLQRMAQAIKQVADFKVKKMMCGKTYQLYTPAAPLVTRHLMIADLDNDTSIRLQQYGLGGAHLMGCGLLLPHKSIKTLKPTE
jgi:CRISPR-associated protein Cas6